MATLIVVNGKTLVRVDPPEGEEKLHCSCGFDTDRLYATRDDNGQLNLTDAVCSDCLTTREEK
jgi:hypothetical protein